MNNNRTSFFLNSDFLKSNLVPFLFLVWFLTLPFGASLFPVSLGVFTIYPNLLVTLLILPICLLSLRRYTLTQFLLLVFFLLWIIFELLIAFKTNISQASLFYIRALIMQFFFAFTLLGVYQILGKEKFIKILVVGLRCFLFVLLISGCIEFLTGIHFAGLKTQELIELPVGNIFYAPMFIYDNPNDFLTYLIFVFLLLNLFDEKIRSSYMINLIMAVVIYIFGTFADSNFAKIIPLILIIIHSAYLISCDLKKQSIFKATPYIFVVVLFSLTVIFNPLFLGPKFKNSTDYRINSISLLKEENNHLKIVPAKNALDNTQQEKLTNYLDSVNSKSPEGSMNLRKNLILNGIDFIKSAPILGIGPGGFADKISSSKPNYFVHTHTSPHNFPIEIISQSGIFGWGYFVFLFYIIYNLFRLQKRISSNQKVSLIVLFISMPCIWMMPSSFIYLNIHWLFLPLLLVYLTMIQEKSISDVIKQ